MHAVAAGRYVDGAEVVEGCRAGEGWVADEARAGGGYLGGEGLG